MADADLKIGIDVSSNVEQATKKTTSGIVSMGKQIEDVQKKFSTGVKDIFLGFFAPMAILQTVISFISDKVAQAKQDAKDGLNLLAEGKSTYATTEEGQAAAFFKRKKEIDDEKKLIEKGREELTKQLLTNPEGRGLVLPREATDRLKAGGTAGDIATMKSVQDAAMEFYKNTPEGKKILAGLPGKPEDQKPGTFKGPEGFSNVVGVGPNPVMEAMTAQLEEQRKQTALLERIAAPAGFTAQDFTKANRAPSRAAMLTGN